MAIPRVLFLMADYGHDPTETAIPYQAFKQAGFDIVFATQSGRSPKADERMLSGITQKLLGANQAACKAYVSMREDAAIQSPLSWDDPSFSLETFDLLFFPGGHEKNVRQVIDSPVVHKKVAEYFPQTRRPSRKAVAAICHGVLVLSESTLPNGKSVLHDVTTTTLPNAFESTAFWSTRLFLGDYYKTYGAGSDSCQTSVKKRLDNPDSQYQCSLSGAPFVVQDESYNYISGRFPPDAELLAEKTITLVKENLKV